ncbi:isthmin-2-like, partial [Cyprinodon tularosa]|uniref:isthmin-2-like n=1 Tax=Cyprinodon tularosa TaxID=77115 RepID=UPI0018E22B00
GKAAGAQDHVDLEHLLQENLPPPPPSSSSRPRFQDRLPAAETEEEPGGFILDLRNFPDLANADVGSQNPNIQVTIEVVEDSQTETEVEIDLAKENQRNDWSFSSSEWINSHRKLFWPLFWEYPEQLENRLRATASEGQSADYNYDPADPDLRGVSSDWGRGWEAKDAYEYEEWSIWAPCSVTCGSGSQRRTRSCGYACTATESRTCDLHSCPSVDSCEKWLSCRTAFLQKYLRQVLTELPSCPCSYPSEVIYSAINVQDSRLQRAYRWRDASGPTERLDIYKPSARFCIRSMLSYHSTTLGAQHCCYDGQRRLITRGKGAGAPNLISTEFSPELHYKVDILPWILCKGDWSRV